MPNDYRTVGGFGTATDGKYADAYRSAFEERVQKRLTGSSGFGSPMYPANPTPGGNYGAVMGGAVQRPRALEQILSEASEDRQYMADRMAADPAYAYDVNEASRTQGPVLGGGGGKPQVPMLGAMNAEAPVEAKPAMQSTPEPAKPALQSEPPVTFADVAEKAPPKEKEKAVKKLEQQGVDISKAYADLMQRMGEKPDTSLSKSDKGMLLMEFGLHMLANSGRMDTGSNIGMSGLNVLNSFHQMKFGKQQAFLDQQDQARAALESYNNAVLDQQEMALKQRKQEASEVGFMQGADGIYQTNKSGGGSIDQVIEYPAGVAGGKQDFVREREDARRARILEMASRNNYTPEQAESIATIIADAGGKFIGDVRLRAEQLVNDRYKSFNARDRQKAGITDEFLRNEVQKIVDGYYGIIREEEAEQRRTAFSSLPENPAGL